MQDHFNVPYNFYFLNLSSLYFEIYMYFWLTRLDFFPQACYRQFSSSLDNKAMERKTQVFQD